jgi:hypothetical protein
MRTEIEVCRELQKWFLSYNIAAWMNEGQSKFYTKKSQKKLDLIIYSKNINKYIGIEVKNGDVAKDLFDASKILEYYKAYINKEIEYYIDEQFIKIDSFCVASMYSIFGKLFQSEKEPLSIDDSKNDKWKVVNKERGLEPYWEFSRTHDYLRNLWSQWRKFREKKALPGVGIILADNLNKKIFVDMIGRPILFDQQWENINGKYQWKVRQKWL